MDSSQTSWLQILALPFISCLTLNRWLNLSVPQFSYLTRLANSRVVLEIK